MSIKMPHAEFDQFWNDVLGDAWYIEEWNIEEEKGDVPAAAADPAEVLVIEYCHLGWQGHNDPEPTRWITAADLAEGVQFAKLVRRWRQQQRVRQLAVEVPAEQVQALRAAVESLGGKLLTR